MTGTGPFHDRNALVNGLRQLADWLESDCTIPVPRDVAIGIRLPNVEQVRQFAHVHQLAEPTWQPNVMTTAALFGPVTYRVYAPGAKQ